MPLFDPDASLSAIEEDSPSDLFLLTFDGNGNDGGTPPPANDYSEGDTVTLPGNIGSLTKSAETFIGWNTQADGLGTSYAVGSVFVMPPAPVTLYAHWTSLPTYTVTYDANGPDSGTAPANQTKVQGIDLPLASNTGGLVRAGYTFAGWNTQDDGNGTSYAEGALYTDDADVTLYAEWTLLPTYTVTYDANTTDGGTAPANQTKIQGTDLTLATNSGGLVKTDRTFAGWNTQADGNGTSYAEGATYTADANLTLYAKWGPLFAGGDGSSGNPYEIYSPEGLDAIRDEPAAEYEIVDDIDLGVAPWNTGAGWVPIPNFSGTLEGNGKIIENLFINGTTDDLGLLAKASAATIENLGLKGVDVSGSGNYVGGLVGQVELGGTTTMTNVYVTGVVSGDEYVGGLTGKSADSTISQSFTDVTVTATGKWAGGVVGRITNGSITNSYTLGDVSGTNYVGGAVGQTFVPISNSYSAGLVSGTGANVGAFSGSGSPTDSYFRDLTGQADGTLGTGLTTAAMLDSTNFGGFNFTTIWDIQVGISFPFLQWQGTDNIPVP